MANIGIDFGTTNSVIVAYNKQKSQFEYPNAKFFGKAVPISSTVMYHDNKIIVGDEARKEMLQHDGLSGYHFERSIKLKLGNYEKIDILGESVEPFIVASEIIKKLKNESEEAASKNLIEMNQAVFTIPIGFGGRSRRELRKAAEKSGIKVKTFIHEPFASIVGYYFVNGEPTCEEAINNINKLNGKYALTFDWGGGTLDITVVKIIDSKMIEVGTSELTCEAGDKIDELIANFVWNKFANRNSQFSLEYMERCKQKNWGKILIASENCKKALSRQQESTVECSYIIDDAEKNIYKDLIEVVTRNDLSELMKEMIDHAIQKVDEAIKTSGINENEISTVLLTGGTCYIPAVQDKMKEKFGSRVQKLVDSELLIAQGAAVISELGWMPFISKDIVLEMVDETYYPIYENGYTISKADHENWIQNEFICVDERLKTAKLIVKEGLKADEKNQIVESYKTLGILKVNLYGSNEFGDDILVETKINEDLILVIRGRSYLIDNKYVDYSVSTEKEIYRLCFGLNFRE